ncbi:hypothetical protein [Paracoccus sp. (in: a-proteobacteria)]|uniref:hypothetical protein n=1 Tax=Paracoccus sp. TaxID=267 RepID=UPI002AFF39EC|nr:hypothetical protein [Paracoccus sp. (in: a-proteobacteria)]
MLCPNLADFISRNSGSTQAGAAFCGSGSGAGVTGNANSSSVSALISGRSSMRAISAPKARAGGLDTWNSTPGLGQGGASSLRNRCFVPAADLKAKGDKDRAPYQEWHDQGLIDVCPAGIIDEKQVEDHIRELCATYDVNERSKLTRSQHLNLTRPLYRKAPRRAALI